MGFHPAKAGLSGQLLAVKLPALGGALQLADALRSNEPTLIEIKVPRGGEVSPWEFINPEPAG